MAWIDSIEILNYWNKQIFNNGWLNRLQWLKNYLQQQKDDKVQALTLYINPLSWQQ